MTIEITISGPAATVLSKIVQQYNQEHPSSPITEENYVKGIINDHLKARVVSKYQAYFASLTIQQMIDLVGTGPLFS